MIHSFTRKINLFSQKRKYAKFNVNLVDIALNKTHHTLNYRPMKIPFLSFELMNQTIRAEALRRFEQFFDSNWYVLGQSVLDFEQKYAQANQVNHAVGVGNGLDALHISLKVLNIGQGDEVIVPSNTYIASALAISYTGATPVFVEPRVDTYNIDPQKIVSAITTKTKAIMPVHLYGQACEMTQIQHIAQENDLRIVEDNAQAHFAEYDGKLTGSFGNINATSFYPGKNFGAFGDAGAITTHNEALAESAKIYRNYGSRVKYYNEVKGINSRLDELQAGLLEIKLPFMNTWTKMRQQIAELYNEYLQNIGDLILPLVACKATHVYHLYVIRTKYRDQLQSFLRDRGVGTLIHYPIPPHLQKAYQELDFKVGDFPIAEEIAQTTLSLPIYPGLTEVQIREITQYIKEFFDTKNSV